MKNEGGQSQQQPSFLSFKSIIVRYSYFSCDVWIILFFYFFKYCMDYKDNYAFVLNIILRAYIFSFFYR